MTPRPFHPQPHELDQVPQPTEAIRTLLDYHLDTAPPVEVRRALMALALLLDENQSMRGRL